MQGFYDFIQNSYNKDKPSYLTGDDTVFKRVFLIVMDSVGIGQLPDASRYGDEGSDTLGNIARSEHGLNLPVMEKMGLGRIAPLEGVKRAENPLACYGKMAELSHGKDTTSGHWEMAGVPLFTSFPTYPNGFPPAVIDKFRAVTGKEVLGNCVASGTVIIEQLGKEHMRTGKPIVYTSADSVFQIAAHEEVIPLDELYRMCRLAREEVCVGEHAVGRIIARPFVGTEGAFVRTSNRHDFSLEPPMPTLLDDLKKVGFEVIGIGKIGDIFAHRGLTETILTKSNDHGMAETIAKARDWHGEGLVMTNLVEFDSLYGHRNDAAGYKRALEIFDGQLGELLAYLTEDDLLLVTADHGCDPTTISTDHSREYVPVLAYRRGADGADLGIRETFADLSATIRENFGLHKGEYGTSFLTVWKGES